MKKFSKLFLSCAAVAALTAAVATSAMAADKSLTASYATDEGGSTGTVTITCESTDEIKTLLILKPGSDRADVKAEKILQINQDAAITEAKVPALSETVEADKGTYTVLMGGTSGDIYVGTFTIGGEPLKIGDANLDKSVDVQDASLVLGYGVGLSGDAIVGKSGTKYNSEAGKDGVLLIGDTNIDGSVDVQDASLILGYGVGLSGDAIVGKAGTEVMASPAE